MDCIIHKTFCRLQPAKRTPPKTSCTKSYNTQRTENKTTDVVIHQHSRKLLKMDVLMSETCWAHNKWNKIASGIKLVFHSSNSTKLTVNYNPPHPNYLPIDTVPLCPLSQEFCYIYSLNMWGLHQRSQFFKVLPPNKVTYTAWRKQGKNSW